MENQVAGNKTSFSGVVCVVAEEEGMLSREKRRFRPSAVVRNPWQGVALDSWAVGIIPPGASNAAGRRYSFRADLEIEWGSAVLRGSTRDISANGMFIEAVDPLWVGAGFTARPDPRSPRKTRLFCETDRAGARHGRVHGRFRVRKPRNFFRIFFPYSPSLVLDPVLY